METCSVDSCKFVIFGASLLHQELQQRERKEVEAVANEFLRSSDSWLTYIVQDGLRSSAESFTVNFNSYSFSTAKEDNLALFFGQIIDWQRRIQLCPYFVQSTRK